MPTLPAASTPTAHDLQSVFNAQPGATLLLSPAWVIVGASDDYLAATLTERDTLVGQFIFEAFPDNPSAPEANAVANVRASLEQVLATKQPHQMAPQHYDVLDPQRPGHFVERHWQSRHTPVLDAQGQVQFIIQSVQDITESRRAEQLLRDSQADEQAARAESERQRGELERVFEQAPVAIAVYRGPNYTIELANPTVARLWGRTREQLLGKGLFEALPEVAGMGYEQLLDAVMATGVPHVAQAMEAQHDRNGQRETVYWDFVYVPMYAADGRINGAMVVANEVTTQVRAHQRVEQLNQQLEERVRARTQELAEHQRLLNQILAQVPAAITTLQGPEHRYSFANDRYQHLVEGRVQLGQTVAETLPEIAEQGFIELLDNVYRSGQTYEGKEIAVLLAQPGQPPVPHYLDFTYQPLPDEHGQTQGLLVFAVDVTEQVRIRRQANALQAQLLATAQSQAQEREAFHHVFEQTPALVALLRAPGHRFEYVNPAYQALFPGRQLVGLDMAEAVPETREQGFVALLDRVYETGETYYGVDVPFAPAATNGGPTFTTYFNFTYQAYRENGQVAGTSIFAFDVTESVVARQEREAQRQQLEQLFMQAPAPIVILEGPDLVYQLVNPAYQQIFPGRALLGQPLLAALPELAGSPLVDSLREVYRTGQPFTAQELPLQLARRAGGPLEDIYWTFTYQARRNAYGEIDGALAFAYDVTEQVRARGETERQRRRLSEVFAQAPVAICVFAGPAYVLEVVNPPMGEMLGYPVAQLVGQPFLEALPELTDQGLRELLDQVRQLDQPYYAQEQNLHLARHGEGGSGYYNFTYQPLRDSAGQVTAVMCVATDVTEQVHARHLVQDLNEELAAINEEMTATNEDLLDTNTRLLRANADLDTFVYAASHDLKSPIANIEGLLNALREYLPTHQQEPMVPRLVRMMEGAITRFQQTVGHLTDVSHLQQGQYSQPVEHLDIPDVLEDVRLDLLPLLESTHTELVVEVASCPNVRFAVKHLRSILFNLLSNAVKYCAPDRAPVVQVRTECTATQFRLAVQDNGLGLSEYQQNQLFTMFRRLHTHVDGSGVGLYLIKRAVENAGGTITVDSQVGVGSTFTVTLPRA